MNGQKESRTLIPELSVISVNELGSKNHSLALHKEGAIVNSFSPDDYEVEFCDEWGVTTALVVMKPNEFLVTWQTNK